MHRYTAKVCFEADEFIENSGDDIDLLIIWIQNQMETSFGDVKGEIIDNKTHTVVKSFRYSPPE